MGVAAQGQRNVGWVLDHLCIVVRGIVAQEHLGAVQRQTVQGLFQITVLREGGLAPVFDAYNLQVITVFFNQAVLVAEQRPA